jgi:hypothetical protein
LVALTAVSTVELMVERSESSKVVGKEWMTVVLMVLPMAGMTVDLSVDLSVVS